MGYIGLNLVDIFGQTMVYTGPLDILCKKGYIGKIRGYICKNYRIYSEKLWDILGKLWDIFG